MDDNTPTDDNSSDFPGLMQPPGAEDGLAGEEPSDHTADDTFETPSPPDSDDGTSPPSSSAASPPPSSPSGLPSIGSLFKRSWALFQKRVIILLALYIISLLMMVIPAAVIIGGGYLASTFIPVPQPISLLIFGLIGVSVGMWTMSWGMAALLLATSDETLGIGGALSQGRSKAWGFLWVYFLMTLVMYGAFILFFIPGIIVSIWLIPTIFVFLNEDARGMEAILKAREYVRGRWGGVFVRLLLFFIMYMVLGMIPLIGPILSLILMPFYLLYLYTLYADLKETKGDFDFQPSRKGKLAFTGLAIAGIVLPCVLSYVMITSNPKSKMMMQMVLGQIMNPGQMQFDMSDFEGFEGFEITFEDEEFTDEEFLDEEFIDEEFINEDFIDEEVIVIETPPATVTPPPAPVIEAAPPKETATPEPAPEVIVVAESSPAIEAETVPVIISGTEPSTPVQAWSGPQYSVKKNIEILENWSLPWIDRNEAARALGQAGDSSAVTPLKRALEEDPESLVRREAALSLGKIGDEAAVKVLTNAAKNDDNEWVVKYAQEALDMIANPDKSRTTVGKAVAATTNEWVVNVASYTSSNEADATFDMLSEIGLDPYITEVTINGTLWYRVRIGFFTSKASADSTKKEVAKELKITDAWSVKASASELSRHSH